MKTARGYGGIACRTGQDGIEGKMEKNEEGMLLKYNIESREECYETKN